LATDFTRPASPRSASIDPGLRHQETVPQRAAYLAEARRQLETGAVIIQRHAFPPR
jgi:hypothetical protein